MLEKETRAPGFSVKDHNGNAVSLADFNGKKSGVMVLPQGRYAGLHC